MIDIILNVNMELKVSRPKPMLIVTPHHQSINTPPHGPSLLPRTINQSILHHTDHHYYPAPSINQYSTTRTIIITPHHQSINTPPHETIIITPHHQSINTLPHKTIVITPHHQSILHHTRPSLLGH